jgi:hypothetical protein
MVSGEFGEAFPLAAVAATVMVPVQPPAIPFVTPVGFAETVNVDVLLLPAVTALRDNQLGGHPVTMFCAAVAVTVRAAPVLLATVTVCDVGLF